MKERKKRPFLLKHHWEGELREIHWAWGNWRLFTRLTYRLANDKISASMALTNATSQSELGGGQQGKARQGEARQGGVRHSRTSLTGLFAPQNTSLLITQPKQTTYIQRY